MDSPLITLMTGPYIGGIGKNRAKLANAFHRLGYKVEVLVDRPDFPYADTLEKGIAVKWLKTSHRVTGIPYLYSYIRKNKPAVLLAPMFQLATLAVRTSRFLRNPPKIFVSIHLAYSESIPALERKKGRVRLAMMKKYYPQCDGIIAVSDGVAEDFSSITGIPRHRIKTIFNPVLTDQLIADAAVQPRHPWFQPASPPVIIAVGRLVSNKNIDDLIQAFQRVRNTRECRLVILGDGPDRDRLESYARSSPFSEDIQFFGYVKNIGSYVKHSSVFVLASSFEGLPSVIIESMSLGTPIVSTDCPHGPREILEDGRLGTLVPVKDPQALSEGIMDALDHPLESSILIKGAEKYKDTVSAKAYLSYFGLE